MCVYHQTREFLLDDYAKSLATRRARVDNIEKAMVDRLIQLGRVEPDFDPLTWMQDAQRKTNDIAHQTYKSERRMEQAYT